MPSLHKSEEPQPFATSAFYCFEREKSNVHEADHNHAASRMSAFAGSPPRKRFAESECKDSHCLQHQQYYHPCSESCCRRPVQHIVQLAQIALERVRRFCHLASAILRRRASSAKAGGFTKQIAYLRGDRACVVCRIDAGSRRYKRRPETRFRASAPQSRQSSYCARPSLLLAERHVQSPL